MNESTVHGKMRGLLSIPRQGFIRLIQSCPIVRTVKYSCNIKEYCVETKEYCEQNETLTT